MTRDRGERRGLLGVTSCHHLFLFVMWRVLIKLYFLSEAMEISPRSFIHAGLYAGLQVLDLFALIKQDIKNISNHIY